MPVAQGEKKKDKKSFLLGIRNKVSGQNRVAAVECLERCHISSLCHTNSFNLQTRLRLLLFTLPPPHNGNGRQQTSAGQLCNILLLSQ